MAFIVEITGWRPGAKKVCADKLLADEAGLGLAAGKRVIERVLDGEVVSLEIEDRNLADSIVGELQGLGFDARLKH